MVKKIKNPSISWEEDFGPQEESSTSKLILNTMLTQLAAVSLTCTRLYFFIPVPTPYARAEADFIASFNTSYRKETNLRVTELPNNGRCYITSSEELFLELIPQAFNLGPAELTFIIANCQFDLNTEDATIANYLSEALQNQPNCKQTRDLSGIHFDSGDLVELF